MNAPTLFPLPSRDWGESWADFKARRREVFMGERFGLRLTYCLACYGSGRYDHNGSPRCGACEGTGKDWVPGPKRPDFKGHHVRSTPRARCRNCGDKSGDLYGCSGKWGQ